MNKNVLKLMSAVALSMAAVYNVYSFRQEKAMTELELANVEALANGEEESGEKIYRYQVWNDDCYVYVGGAYAKGKKVTCFSGKDHPICVDCQL